MELRSIDEKWLCPECGSHKEPNEAGMCQACDIAWPTIQLRYDCPFCGEEVVHEITMWQREYYACTNEDCKWALEIDLQRVERVKTGAAQGE